MHLLNKKFPFILTSFLNKQHITTRSLQYEPTPQRGRARRPPQPPSVQPQVRAHRTRAPDTPAETTVSPQTGLQRSIGFFPLNGELSGRAVVWMDMYVAHTHTPLTHTPLTHTHTPYSLSVLLHRTGALV